MDIWPTGITAHAGCEGTPADSLESVLLGAELGADAVEVDVRRGADGALILSHDPRADRAGTPLQAVFEALRCGGVRINCDVKEAEVVPDLLAMAREQGFGRERLTLSGSVSPGMLRENPDIAARAQVAMNLEEALESFGYRNLWAQLRAQCPNAGWEAFWPYLATLSGRLERQLAHLARLLRELGAQSLNLPAVYLTPARLEKLHGAGLRVSVWTVDDPEEMAWLMAGRAENLTTRRVRDALAVRRRLYTPV